MKDLAESLSPIERKIFPLIRDNISLRELIEKSRLQEVEVIRALQWLENKELIKVRKEEKEIIEIDANGKKALEKGLPEKRFLTILGGNIQVTKPVAGVFPEKVPNNGKPQFCNNLAQS